MRKNKITLATVMALALAPPALAQESDAKIKFGFRAGLTLPQDQDVVDNVGNATSYGLVAEWKLGQSSNALSANGEYIWFPGVDWGNGVKTGAKAIRVGVDFMLRPMSFEKGFFAFTGLGYVSGQETAQAGGITVSASATGPCYSAGLGWDWRGNGLPLGIEIRYINVKLNFKDFGTVEDFSSIQFAFRSMLPL
jgi:hypothetical protein